MAFNTFYATLTALLVNARQTDQSFFRRGIQSILRYYVFALVAAFSDLKKARVLDHLLLPLCDLYLLHHLRSSSLGRVAALLYYRTQFPDLE